MDVFRRLLIREPVIPQALLNDVVVEDRGMGPPVGEDLQREAQIPLRGVGRAAESHRGIDEPHVVHGTDEHPREGIRDDGSVREPPADHEAAGESVRHASVDLDAEAVDEGARLLVREDPRRAVRLVVGQEPAVRASELELQHRRAQRLDGDRVGDERRGLDRFPEGARGIFRHPSADRGDLAVFVRLPPVFRLPGELLRSVRVPVREDLHAFEAGLGCEIKVFLPHRIGIVEVQRGEIPVDHGRDARCAEGEEPAVVDRHVRILPDARMRVARGFVCPAELLPLLICISSQRGTSDDQFARRDVHGPCGICGTDGIRDPPLEARVPAVLVIRGAPKMIKLVVIHDRM